MVIWLLHKHQTISLWHTLILEISTLTHSLTYWLDWMTHPRTVRKFIFYFIDKEKTWRSRNSVYPVIRNTFYFSILGLFIHHEVKNASGNLQGFTRKYRGAVENINCICLHHFWIYLVVQEEFVYRSLQKENTGSSLQCLWRRICYIWYLCQSKRKVGKQDCELCHKKLQDRRKTPSTWEHDHLLQAGTQSMK